MTFEVDGVRVIQSLIPYQSPRYIEHVDDAEYTNVLDQLYHLTTIKKGRLYQT